MDKAQIRHFLLFLAFFYSQFVHSAEPILPTDGEKVASLSCIYGLTTPVPGCPISSTTAVPQGGSGIIAVIDGGNDPDALLELNQFSSQMGLNGLPQCGLGGPPCFQTVYANATTCAVGSTASSPVTIIEPEIDIEWAHAMAPNASIYMIQTDSWGIEHMMQGIQCANSLLQSTGGIISFSDSFPESSLGPGELSYDINFKIPGIIYVMSSGDFYAPARYPATSPYVIAAGGTTIERDRSGNYIRQVAWKNTGIPCDPDESCKLGVTGGPSAYEPRPSYQNSVQKIVGNKRGTPDISFAAQGVDVFCCSYVTSTTGNEQCCIRPGSSVNPNKPSLTACQTVDTTMCASGFGTWVKSGGTSLAAPALAGIINSAHSGATSSVQELTNIYNNALKNYQTYWTDITIGNNGFPALKGYDFDTGLGVPRGYGGK